VSGLLRPPLIPRSPRDRGARRPLTPRPPRDRAARRPRRSAFNHGDPDLPALAAAYATGIIKNHPFVDGNNTGFAAAATFLDRNRLELAASEAEATRMTLNLAAGDLSEEEYAAWLRERIGSS
jgi:death-on-curing protein